MSCFLKVSFAQHIGYKQYTVIDGLPQSEVVSLFEDSKGFLWVGTKYGVGRFNGTDFQSYTDEKGILSSGVDLIGELSNGIVLTLTQYGYVLHRFNNPLKSVKFPLFRSGVYSFSWFDEEKKAYTVFYNKYLFIVYELTTQGLVDATQKFAYLKAQLSSGKAVQIFFSKVSNGFYINTFNSLKYLDSSQSEDLPFINVENLIEDRNGVFYMIYTGKSMLKTGNNLDRTMMESATLKAGSILKLNKGSFESIFTHPNLLDKQKTIFAVADSEYFMFSNLIIEEMIFVNHEKQHAIKCSSHTFRSFYFDKNNQLWGASSQGLVKFFPHYFVNYSSQEGINDDLQSVVADHNNRIWLSSYYKGLQFIENGKVKYFSENPENEGRLCVLYPGSNIDNTGKIHFSSTYSTSIVLDTKKGFKINFNPKPWSSLYFLDDTLGKCYYHATTAGIMKRDYNSNSYTQLSINPGPKSNNHAVSIVKQSANKLFIGGFKALLIYSDSSIEKIPNSKHIDMPGANAMVKDYKGNVWIGNVGGLYLYSDGKFTKIKNDYFNSLVLSLYAIDSSKLFIGAIGRIGFIDLKQFYDENKLLIRCFDKQNGFIGGECQQNAISRDNNGYLWIACSEGVVCINPSEFDCNPLDGGVVLNGLYCYHEELSWDTIAINKNSLDKLQFNHEENNLRFEFAATNSFLPENSLFTYKLEGFDKTWSTPSHLRIATYTNLPPGNYKFMVTLAGYTNTDKKSFDYIEFSVQSSFWSRWYVWLILAILFISLLIVGVSHYLTRINRMKSVKLERERKFSQLQFKALRSQLEPHFIFNAFNTLGASIYTEDKQQSYDYLQQFSKLIRTTLSNADKSFRTLREELDFVSNYLDLEKRRFGEKLDYEILIDPEADTLMQVPKLIIQTFVVYAINHGLINKFGKGKVLIAVKNEVKNLIILICDNRKECNEKKSSGSKSGALELDIIMEYVQLLNQSSDLKIEFDLSELTLTKDSEEGNCVKIKIPKEINN